MSTSSARATGRSAPIVVALAMAMPVAVSVAAEPDKAPGPVAQPASPAPPPTPPTPAAPAPYVDRIIEGLSSGDDDVDASSSVDTTGWPRHLRIDLRGAREQSTIGGAYSLATINVFGALETPSWGSFLLDADLQRDNAAAATANYSLSGLGRVRSMAFTLRQRGFPLGGGVLVDNELGTLALPTASLSGMSARVYVPGHRVEGFSSRVLSDQAGWMATASVGSPLQYDGLFAARVQKVPGRVAQVGVQFEGEPEAGTQAARQTLLPVWRVGMQVAQGSDLAPFGSHASAWRGATAPDASVRFDARSIWLGASGLQNQVRWQAHAVASNLSSQQAPDAFVASSRGAWLDATWRGGAMRHNVGGYMLGRGLNWAGLPMAADLQGAFYRGTWSTRQWMADGGVDVLRSSSVDGLSGYYLTGGLRRRIDSFMQLGGTIAFRSYNGRALTAGADVQWRHDLGQTDLRADVQQEFAGSRNLRLTLQHDWAMSESWTVANSVSVGRLTQSGNSTGLWALAASFDAPITQRLSVRGALSFESVGDQRRSGANLGLSWPVATNWLIEGGFNLDRGRSQTLRPVDPLAPPETAAPLNAESRSAFITLRYERRGGTGSSPLGGRWQDGGGSVEGIVFLDANGNGQLDAGERGAAGVTVMLDGRYPAKTDGQGRFEFALVSGGERNLTVLNETLPLPWSAPDDGRREITVRLRQTTKVQIAVTK